MSAGSDMKTQLVCAVVVQPGLWIAQEVGNRKEGYNARGLLQKVKQSTRTKPKYSSLTVYILTPKHTRRNLGSKETT